MESYYDINVSLNGRHFFATAPRSARDEGKAKRLLAELRKRFPVSEGYHVTVTWWQGTGHTCEWANDVEAA